MNHLGREKKYLQMILDPSSTSIFKETKYETLCLLFYWGRKMKFQKFKCQLESSDYSEKNSITHKQKFFSPAGLTRSSLWVKMPSHCVPLRRVIDRVKIILGIAGHDFLLNNNPLKMERFIILLSSMRDWS